MNSTTEFAWLIERGTSSTTLYLSVHKDLFDWTSDQNKAIRFPRREDAEMVARVIGDEVERIAEHGWHTLPSAAHLPPSVPEGWKLVPVEPGTCELDDSGHLFAFMLALHSNVPEKERPTGWSDFNDNQRERIKAAYRAMIASSPLPPPEAGCGWNGLCDALAAYGKDET